MPDSHVQPVDTQHHLPVLIPARPGPELQIAGTSQHVRLDKTCGPATAIEHGFSAVWYATPCVINERPGRCLATQSHTSHAPDAGLEQRPTAAGVRSTASARLDVVDDRFVIKHGSRQNGIICFTLQRRVIECAAVLQSRYVQKTLAGAEAAA
jgi:hypothetical protein